MLSTGTSFDKTLRRGKLMVMQKIPLSLVVITLNEEKNIKRCLESAPFVSEIIVIDSGSSDSTCKIAEGLGAKVFHEEWKGFGPQKRLATQKASYDWVLQLDADEALSPELAAEILERFSSLNPETAYTMPRLSFHLGRWIRHGGWYPDYQTRLYNRQYSNWSSAVLHEKVEARQVQKLNAPILHWVFRDLSQNVVTNDRYSTLGAQDYLQKGKKFSLLSLLFRPWGKFIECYFFKLGFMDGLPGFIIAVGAAYSLFLRYAKMWEKSKASSK